MEKQFFLLLVSSLLILCSTCSATVYTVGDNSGWDISTDLDTWVKDKQFTVGDVLVFQYSSYHSVSEVTKENYEGCNTTDVLQAGSNGNTTYALSKPGDRYFVCGNRLHCLGGMKLHVNVEGGDKTEGGAPAAAPTAGGFAPQPESGASLPPHSSKANNNPSVIVPSGAAFVVHVCISTLVIGLIVGFVGTILSWI